MARRDCVQCLATTKGGHGQRCTRTTCIYPSYCWQHAGAHYSTKLAASTIPRAGLGLFARRDLSPREVIAAYTGHVSREPIDGDYVIQINRRKFIDASSTQSSMARYANDCRTASRRAGHCSGNNAKFTPSASGADLRVGARPIRAGEEIFVDYGRDYHF